MSRKVVAIMQPTYLPWSGYFDLIDQADTFIFLDNVQFAKRSWQQRNRLKTPQGELMLTVPVQSKGERDQLITEVVVDPSLKFYSDHLKAVQFNYAKAPFFKEIFPEISQIYQNKYPLLVDLNLALIHYFCEKMQIKKEILRSSQMEAGGRKVDRLVHLCQEVGATDYLSAPGSSNYIEQNNLFAELGLALSYQQFTPPTYPQLHGAFIPYLSVLDLLLNVGPVEALKTIRGARS